MITELQKKLEKTAAILKARVDHSGDWGTRLHLDGFSVFTRVNGPRLEFSVSVPRSNEIYTLQHGFKTSIGVSSEKTAEKIAADLMTRLIPDAIAYRDMILGRLKEHDDYISSRDGLKKRVYEAMGETPKHTNTDNISGYVNRNGENERYFSANVGRDTVNLNLSGLTIEQVEAIGKLLRKK